MRRNRVICVLRTFYSIFVTQICSSTMFSLRDGCAVALLLVSMQALALASLKEDEEDRINLAKIIVTSMDAPLIKGMKSVIRNLDSNSSCATELSVLIDAIAAGEIWAVEMLDASSKIQSGILNGNLHDLGMYGQCIQASGEYNNTKVQGRHCSVSFRTSYEGSLIDVGDASITLTSSVCVPSSCDSSQVIDIATAAFEQLLELVDSGLILNVTAGSCARIESEDFTVGEIWTMSVFTSIAVVILSCTICDFVKRREPVNANGIVDTLAKFSLWTNAKNILSTKITSGLMPALQGIRFLCMCWIILGHRYFTSLFKPTVNLGYLPDWSNTWEAIYIQTAPFAVDTFFVISGFLMSHQYLTTLRSGRRLNIPLMYIHRYLRLTPSIGVVMLFVIFFLHRVGNGPIWSTLSNELITNCEKNWWVNLLYVQNFVNPKEMCIGHTWYLAVDMQLFWVSPILLYPLYRWPKYGLGFLTCLLGISVATPTVLVAIYNYNTAVLRLDDSDPDNASFFYLYIPTYNRACAYLVGIYLGYDVVNHKRIFRKVTVAINWIMVFVALVFCAWITHITHKTDYEYNEPLEITSALILRPIWSVATAWVAYACTQGYGGFVAMFLSSPIFLPLSRLSYCIYLVHIVIQYTKNAAVQIPGIFSPFRLFNEFVADLVLSIIVALFLSLFFESPVVILEKLLRNCGSRPDKSAIAPKSNESVEGGIENRAMSST